MLTVTPGDIEAALLSLIPQLATRVPDDILSGLVAARETRVRYGCAWKPALTCWFPVMCSLV